MLPDVVGIAIEVAAPFVNVVAGMEDEIELLLRDAAVRGEVTGLIVAAAADAKTDPLGGRARRRRGLGAADLAHLTAAAETVEIFAAGLEAVGVDMDAVPELGPRDRSARSHDGAELPIARDLPGHFDIRRRH